MIPKIEIEWGTCFICGETCSEHDFLCNYCKSQIDEKMYSVFSLDKYDITNKFFNIINVLTYTELLSSINTKVKAIFTLISLALEQYEDYNDLYLFTKLHYLKKLINEDIINYISDTKHLNNKNTNSNHFDLKQKINQYNNNLNNQDNPTNFRKNNPNDYICKDGHNVRSLSELVIDNFLYDNNIKHIYEKSIYTKDNKILTTDFYLPESNIYLEFWGLLNDYEYKRKREYKLEHYNQLNLSLIEIFPEHLKSLSDYLLIKIENKNQY